MANRWLSARETSDESGHGLVGGIHPRLRICDIVDRGYQAMANAKGFVNYLNDGGKAICPTGGSGEQVVFLV